MTIRRSAQTTTTDPIRFAYRVCIGSRAGMAPNPDASPSEDSASCTSAYVHGVANPAVTTRSYQALRRTTRR
ncbi:hypothetical protein SPAR_10157 [Streptomyces sparsogenes DSM 40356]|uniref:Uncharacterized protein n=1 Tax=Streptomyces sparsogenes DSM 40356 TaxID=1331668 RepID=A0A1R1SMM4_9ACTN|nr:hypothetical protein SPAR_10157 [Streptomyces sparsogenes DSM 40356]